MAIVYRAMDLRHNRDVAIKVLRPEFAAALGGDRFLREIKIASQLQHPHILALYDSGQVNGILFYVMPFVEGESLRERIAREGQLSVDDAISVTREVASALSYAHDLEVVHRDIKPENILFRSGHASVGDFGVARALSDAGGKSLTQSGIAVGTPAYMSPEQGGGGDHVDARSDIYSLACVLFEMLAGEPPFTGRTAQAIIARHMHERLPSLEVVRPDMPVQVISAVEKALAKVPADRFPSVEEFVEAVSAPHPEDEPTSMRVLWALIAGIGVVLAAFVAIGLGWREAPLDPNKVVGFPLSERGLGLSQAGAGFGVARLIEVSLEHADPLKLIDAAPWLSDQQLANPEYVGAADASDICESRGAAYYITGTVQGHGDSTTVSLRLWDVRGDSVVERSSQMGATADIPLHHLGVDAVKDLLPELIDPGRVVDLTPIKERNAEAIALWIQGERQYRLAQFESALDFYERAVGVDSAMWFAATKGAQAASWIHRMGKAKNLVQLALKYDSLLPPRFADFALGLEAYLDGRADSAVASFERALASDSGWAEANTALGETLYHLFPQGMWLDSLSEVSLLRAFEADSAFTPPLVHLTEIAVRRGDIAHARDMFELLDAARSEASVLRYLSLMLRCVESGSDAAVWLEALPEDAGAVLSAAKLLAVAGAQRACAEGAYRSILVNPEIASGSKWGAFLGLQGLLVAEGRDEEAIALIDSTVSAGTRYALSLYVLNLLAGAGMEAKAPEMEAFARARFGDSYEGIGSMSLWLLGLWQAYSNEVEEVARLHHVLAGKTRITHSRRDSLFAGALSAHLALLRGDTATAIERFRSVKPTAPRDSLSWSLGEPLPYERLTLARLLCAGGQYAEAIRVAQAFDHPEPIIYGPFLAASLTVRLSAASALNRSDLIARYRDRLLQLGRPDLVDVRHYPPTSR
jgi:serine/threonine-protein kinase